MSTETPPPVDLQVIETERLRTGVRLAGEEVCPTQPMVSQTRAVLERGLVTEVVYPGVGHSPHLEERERFVDDVRRFLLAG